MIKFLKNEALRLRGLSFLKILLIVARLNPERTMKNEICSRR
jgi:hypothetical protein